MPEIKSLSLLTAIIAAINNIIAIIETIGLMLVMVLIRDLHTYWMIAPNNMGIIITFTIVIIIGSNATFTHVPPIYRISKGVTIGAINVDVIVIPTESGTSPLAMYVMTLLAVPPGQQPTNMTPIAKSGDKLKIWQMPQANSGIIVY